MTIPGINLEQLETFQQMAAAVNADVRNRAAQVAADGEAIRAQQVADDNNIEVAKRVIRRKHDVRMAEINDESSVLLNFLNGHAPEAPASSVSDDNTTTPTPSPVAHNANRPSAIWGKRERIGSLIGLGIGFLVFLMSPNWLGHNLHGNNFHAVRFLLDVVWLVALTGAGYYVGSVIGFRVNRSHADRQTETPVPNTVNQP